MVSQYGYNKMAPTRDTTGLTPAPPVVGVLGSILIFNLYLFVIAALLLIRHHILDLQGEYSCPNRKNPLR